MSHLPIDPPGLENLLVQLVLALGDPYRKVLLDELQQEQRVDARHGQRVREEGQRRAGRGRRPTRKENEA